MRFFLKRFLIFLFFLIRSAGADSLCTELFARSADAAGIAHPFACFQHPSLACSYEQMYGLTDLYSMHSSAGFALKRVQTQVWVHGTSAARVYRKFDLGAGFSSNLFKTVHARMGIKGYAESFGENFESPCLDEISGSLGVRSRALASPFVGVQGHIEGQMALVFAGIMISAADRSALLVSLSETTDQRGKIRLLHEIRFHPNLLIFWSLENQPVRFGNGILLSIFKGMDLFADYKTHSVLGTSYGTGLMVRR